MLALMLTTVAAATPQWLGTPPARVTRIVSLAPSATEIIFALGAGEQVVGVTRYDNFPEAVIHLPRVGGFNDPDPEAVLALAPDLVVAIPTSGGRGRVDLIARLGPPVLVVPGQTLDDLWIAIRELGAALDRRQEADALALRVRGELAQVRQEFASRAPARVLVVVGRRPLVAAGPGTFIDALLREVAGRNVVTRGGAYPQLDVEAVIGFQPDVIIDVTIGEEGGGAFWERLARLQGLQGVRLTLLPDDTLLRPGPRLPAGTRKLAQAVHGVR